MCVDGDYQKLNANDEIGLANNIKCKILFILMVKTKETKIPKKKKKQRK